MLHGQRQKYRHFLKGRGMEIGALNMPFSVSDRVEVLYSDVMTPEQVNAHHPGSKLPDIVSDSERYPTLNDNSLDFIIANHVLEHLTDPIQALKEWFRILKTNGILYLTIPDKRFTFDKERNRTPLSHLVADHGSTLEPRRRNYAHLLEWATHVEKLPPHSPTWKAWIERQLANGYSVHNHVWVLEDILELLDYMREKEGVTFHLAAGTDTHPNDIEFILILASRKAPFTYLDKLKERLSFRLQSRRLLTSGKARFVFSWPKRAVTKVLPQPIKRWMKARVLKDTH